MEDTSTNSSVTEKKFYLKRMTATQELIPLKKNEFKIGRNQTAVDHAIADIIISRTHVVMKRVNDTWTIENKSPNYLLVNERKIDKSEEIKIQPGDVFKLGQPEKYYEFHFLMKEIKSKNELKRKRSDNSEQLIENLRLKNETEQKMTEEKILLEERLQQEKKNKQIILVEKAKLLRQMEDEKEEMEKKLREECMVVERQMSEEKEALRNQLAAIAEKNAQLEQEVQSKEEDLKMKENLKLKEEELQKKTMETMQGEKEKMEARLKELETNLEEKVLLTSTLAVELKQKEETDKRLVALMEDKQKLEARLEEATKEGEQVTDLQNALFKLESEKSSLEKNATKLLVDNVTNVVENEFQCPICNELLMTAMMLNCSHVFCKFCLDCWKKTKRDCPNCRAAITTEARAYVLDNFIENIASALSKELKQRRKDTIAEREAELEEARKVAEKAAAARAAATGNRRGRNRGRGNRRGGGEAQRPPRMPVALDPRFQIPIYYPPQRPFGVNPLLRVPMARPPNAAQYRVLTTVPGPIVPRHMVPMIHHRPNAHLALPISTSSRHGIVTVSSSLGNMSVPVPGNVLVRGPIPERPFVFHLNSGTTLSGARSATAQNNSEAPVRVVNTVIHTTTASTLANPMRPSGAPLYIVSQSSNRQPPSDGQGSVENPIVVENLRASSNS